MIIEKHFKTKKSALRSIVWGYILGFGFLFIGTSYYMDYKNKGYYLTPIDLINIFNVKGVDALVSSIGIIIGSSIVIAYTIYITSLYIVFSRKGDFSRNTAIPLNIICLGCQEAFDGSSVKSLICPKCGSKMEDLEGYYLRHPEFNK